MEPPTTPRYTLLPNQALTSQQQLTMHQINALQLVQPGPGHTWAYDEHYHLILFRQAEQCSLYIDFEQYFPQAHALYLVMPGQYHHMAPIQVQPNTAVPVQALVMSVHQAVVANNPDQKLMAEWLTVSRLHPEWPLDEPDSSDLTHIVHTYLNQHKHNQRLAVSFFTAFCARMLATTPIEMAGDALPLPDHLLHRFIDLVNTHYDSQQPLTWYAEQLQITTRHLGRLTRNFMGNTPTDMIQQRLNIQAKRLLTDPSLQIKDVAHRLHFAEPVRFTEFFKRLNNQTPGQFRQTLYPG